MFIDMNGMVVNDGATILNGVGQGSIGEGLSQVRFDPGMLRPFFDEKGERCVTMNTGRTRYNDKTKRHEPIQQKMRIADLMNRGIYHPVFNATSLRKEAWIQMDQAVIREARQRLRAWADLSARNSFGGFNAMAKSTLEYEAQNDPGFAVVDMDALTPGTTDSPLFKLRSIPLPITHSDFWFSERRLAESRSSGTPLDTTMAEAAGRRVAETIEQTLIGSITGLSYGYQSAGVTAHDSTYGSQIYGYTNFPSRNTKSNLTVPTGSNPNATVADILSMRSQMYDDRFYGPYMIYHSTDWDAYMDNDYYISATGAPFTTLRDRIRNIEGILDVRRLDFLTNTFTLLMVQMTSDVVRAINGMDITTVQWEEKGGMKKCFKVMCIQVPQIRADYNDRCGILHATTA